MSVFPKHKWKSYRISDLYVVKNGSDFILKEIKMPSATDESREAMRKMFGDPISDTGPHDFLRSHGYTDKAGMLRPPKPDHLVTTEEWACIEFLCDEWDYGFDPELPL